MLIKPGCLPIALPQTLDNAHSLLSPSEPALAPAAPMTLFLTVDVEDSYFKRPILMCGDGIGREFGVFGILDEFDYRDLKGTFFVNVYEKDHQPSGVVEEVVREIAGRGHEVGLHAHPSPAHDFYHRPLFRLPLAEQVDVLRWGAGQIAEWTGEYPTSFRAGGYALNDETLAALEEVGIQVDSSCFFPSPNNHNKRHTVNAVARLAGGIEVPVTTVLRATSAGGLAHRKLDLDWLSGDQLNAALTALIQHQAASAMFMMHSFSFIEKETRKLDRVASSHARFVSEVRQDRYVEVFGPKPKMRDVFSGFLDRLSRESSVRVRTLREELPCLYGLVSSTRDVVPIVS